MRIYSGLGGLKSENCLCPGCTRVTGIAIEVNP